MKGRLSEASDEKGGMSLFRFLKEHSVAVNSFKHKSCGRSLLQLSDERFSWSEWVCVCSCLSWIFLMQ